MLEAKKAKTEQKSTFAENPLTNRLLSIIINKVIDRSPVFCAEKTAHKTKGGFFHA